MNESIQDYHVSPLGVKELLSGGGEFLPPEKLLGDLTDAQAMAVAAGSFYSVAQIVAHMHYWQERNIRQAQGETLPHPEHLDETFPAVQSGEWETLRRAFLAGLETCAQVAREEGNKTSSGRADTTLAFDLAECPALHNAYHFGQIAMLRQIQGFWPPEGGDGGW